MRKYIIILTALLLHLTASADYTLGTIDVTVNGGSKAAVARLDATNHVALLGNGCNACIPSWCEGSLVIPGSVNIGGTDYTVEVGPLAFRLCNSLTSITINEGVQKIDDYAFVGCSAVTKVTLPASLTTIARGAFCNLNSLKTMRCKSTDAPEWEWNDVFTAKGTKASMREKSYERILYIPEGNLDSYKSTKFDGTSTGTLTAANEKVGWEEAFARIYELRSEPYAINSFSDLIAFRNAVNEGRMMASYSTDNFVLTADIEMPSGVSWACIGSQQNPFSGIFDGGGHTISNLNITSSNDNQGLFGCATEATIYNLYLKNPTVQGKDKVGTLIGQAFDNVTLSDVLVTSNASGASAYTVKATDGSGGGIVGWAGGATIARCYFEGEVKTFGWAGGIVGYANSDVKITDCYVGDFVQANNTSTARVGSILGGTMESVNIDRCLVRNCVSLYNSSGSIYGVLIGGADKGGTISNCAYRTWGDFTTNVIGNVGGTAVTTTNIQEYANNDDLFGDATKAQLGTDNWTYFTDNYQEYPIPTTLVDMLEKNVYRTDANGLVYRPVGSKGNPVAYEVLAYTGNAASVTIPDTYDGKPVTAIFDNVFKANQTLATITLGSNLQTIGQSAFEDCDALTAVDLPDAVNMVKRDAFRGCDNLTSFNIGTGFRDHEGNFLAYCSKLTTLTASRGNDNGYICVDNVMIHNTNVYTSYIIVCAPGQAGDYTIPVSSCANDYIVIFPYCFASCEKLTSITFPQIRTGNHYCYYSLSQGIFDGAYNLRYVDMSQIYRIVSEEQNWGWVDLTVNRGDPDNPFYGMSQSTIIYLSGNQSHTAAIDEVNVVIGGSANSIELTDGWDFNPPMAISAGKATLKRTLVGQSVVYAKVVTDEQGNVVYTDEYAPVYENGNPVYEEDGVTQKMQRLPKMESEERFDPRGYTSYLPYALTLTAENAKVYAPTTIEEVEGVTTVTFSEVANKEMAAYTPYYIIVEGEDAVELSTSASTTIAVPSAGEPAAISGFMFKGTTVKIPNTTLYDADKPVYILQSDGWWHKVPNNQPLAYVGPYRAYFQATTANGARSLAMIFSSTSIPDDGSAPNAIEPVIRTIDADGTERYFDLSGRIIVNGKSVNGKSQRGIVIRNGRKILR